MRVIWHPHGRFAYEDGRPFVPFGGIYANFIQTREAGIRVKDAQVSSMRRYRHSGVIDFVDATPAQLRKWIKWLRAEGMTFVRMFSRGVMEPAQDPLDIGGAVNRPLLEKMRAYLDLLHEAGIYCHFVACVEPRQTIYMNPRVLEQRVLPLHKAAGTDVAALSPHRRRFLDPETPRLTYRDYFSDPDVLACHRDYLIELAPLLRDHPALMSLEVYNEQQWGDHFFWSVHDDEMAWSAAIIETMHEHFPGVPAACSFAGFGFAAQDPLRWIERVPMDFISPHLYQMLAGRPRCADFGVATDAVLKYSQHRLPTMMGEWDPQMHLRQPCRLLTRDAAWFALLNGCPGFGMWMCRGYNEFAIPRQIADAIDYPNFQPAPEATIVDISRHVRFFQSLEDQPHETCAMPEDLWCPHRPEPASQEEDTAAEADETPEQAKGRRHRHWWRSLRDEQEPHRYCVKVMSEELQEIYHFARFALICGLRYRFTSDPAEANWNVRHVGSHRLDQLDIPFTPVDRCVQVKYTSSADGEWYIVYLRNFQGVAIDGSVGRTAARPRPVSLDIRLPADYDVKIWDLDTGKMRIERFLARCRFSLATTGNDHALLLRRV